MEPGWWRKIITWMTRERERKKDVRMGSEGKQCGSTRGNKEKAEEEMSKSERGIWNVDLRKEG